MAVNPEVKARIKASRNKHDLHVLFLMDKEGLSKPDAIVLAYLQGYSALGALLAPQPEAPPTNPPPTAK